jgi:hypothetical protein
MRRVGGGAVTQFYDDLGSPEVLPVALAGSRALWAFDKIGNNVEGFVHTGAAGGRGVRGLAYVMSGPASDATGDVRGGVASDGKQTLVFSLLVAAVDDPTTCDPEGYDCTIVYRGGGVWRVVRGRKVRVPNTPGSFLLAASGSRIALVVPGDSRHPGRSVQVRRVADGGLVAALSASAPVRAIGLSSSVVAVLVAGDAKGPKRIEWYEPDTGASLGALDLPSQAGSDLSLSGRRILFRVGRQLRLLDTRTGRTRTVAAPQRTPFSPSLEGKRLLWAENAARGSVVRMVIVR